MRQVTLWSTLMLCQPHATRDLIDRYIRLAQHSAQLARLGCESTQRATHDRKVVLGMGTHVLASIDALPAQC